MLSTAINFYNGDSPYRSTHVNHPCSIWVRESQHNYQWLLDHFEELCKEYTRRYGKIHKCEQYLNIFKHGLSLIPDRLPTRFANCTTFKDVHDVNKAYRLYLSEKWLKDKRPAQCKWSL
jgi:hypothetical protein